jgi:hypothetical protein
MDKASLISQVKHSKEYFLFRDQLITALPPMNLRSP